MTMSILRTIIVSVLLIFGIFFAMFPHSIHCNFVKLFDMPCISHKYHIFMGIVFFLLAVYIQQTSYLH